MRGERKRRASVGERRGGESGGWVGFQERMDHLYKARMI